MVGQDFAQYSSVLENGTTHNELWEQLPSSDLSGTGTLFQDAASLSSRASCKGWIKV